MTTEPEPQAVAERYARRIDPQRYSMLRPDVWLTLQERQRAMLQLFNRLGWREVDRLSVLEVGCGSGGNLLELLQIGFAPQHLSGIELLHERFAQARVRLPVGVTLWEGDASALDLPPESHDIVYVSTLFSSLLDADFQERLAAMMWRWVRPGGGVMWYDFTHDNPRNPDVRGVRLGRIRSLFPHAEIETRRVTLAPPIARRVAPLHPSLYALFNLVPWLRTHRLCWLGKR